MLASVVLRGVYSDAEPEQTHEEHPHALRCSWRPSLPLPSRGQSFAARRRAQADDAGRPGDIIAETCRCGRSCRNGRGSARRRSSTREKMTGPHDLQLVNVPERDALDILLRSASGYIAAPRPVSVADAAIFDRVTNHARRAARRPRPRAPRRRPPFQRPPQRRSTIATSRSTWQMPPQQPPNPVTAAFPGSVPGSRRRSRDRTCPTATPPGAADSPEARRAAAAAAAARRPEPVSARSDHPGANRTWRTLADRADRRGL